VETLKDDSPLVLEEIDKNFSSDVLSNLEKSENFTKKKRGKRTYNTKNKEHTKNKNDNRVIKIQSHYFNFIITFLNELMEIFKIKYSFLYLDKKFKIHIKIEHRKSLMFRTIKDLIINVPISIKCSTKDKSYNKIIYERLKEENHTIILDIMDKNYLYFFDKIYYKNNRNFNLNQFGLIEQEIKLSNKVKMFTDLINKEGNNNSDYQQLMEKCARLYFLSKEFNINY